MQNGTAGNVNLNYDFDIDWGDGSKIQQFNKNGTDGKIRLNGESSSVCHYYKKPGRYVISLRGICDCLYGWANGGDNLKNIPDSNTHISPVECLTSVMVPKGYTSPLLFARGSFFGCSLFDYISPDLFENLKNCREMLHVFDGCALEYVFENFFKDMPLLEKADYIFELCKFKYLPPKLFHNVPNLHSLVHSFHQCRNLVEIPEGFFDKIPNLRNIDCCFLACDKVTKVPSNLFHYNTKLENVTSCFSKEDRVGAPNMFIDTIPVLWNTSKYPNITNYSNYCTGCTIADNYSSAPNSWKGISEESAQVNLEEAENICYNSQFDASDIKYYENLVNNYISED